MDDKNERIEIKILLVGHSLRKPAAEHAKIQIYGDGKHIVASSGSKNDTEEVILEVSIFWS